MFIIGTLFDIGISKLFEGLSVVGSRVSKRAFGCYGGIKFGRQSTNTMVRDSRA